MRKIHLFFLVLLVAYLSVQVLGTPIIAIGFPQKPINDKVASLWIYPADKNDEVKLTVMIKTGEGELLIKYGDVEVSAVNADGKELQVILAEGDKASYGWGSNLWQQGEYRFLVGKGEKAPSIKVKWKGSEVVFKLSESWGGTIDWFLDMKYTR
jgi:hypothetical protein